MVLVWVYMGREVMMDDQLEWAILSAQDWLLESDDAKKAIPSRKARLELCHPLRLHIQARVDRRLPVAAAKA